MKSIAWKGNHFVEDWICTYTPTQDNNGPLCGKPAVYSLEFAGWPEHERSLACAEHTQWARMNLAVRRVHTV